MKQTCNFSDWSSLAASESYHFAFLIPRSQFPVETVNLGACTISSSTYYVCLRGPGSRFRTVVACVYIIQKSCFLQNDLLIGSCPVNRPVRAKCCVIVVDTVHHALRTMGGIRLAHHS